MEDKQVIVKTIEREFKDKIEAGIAWFRFIAAINSKKLTERELQLLSFINSRGTISSTSAKEEFCRIFESSTGTIANMIGPLIRSKFLIKEKSKVKINPSIKVEFDNDLVMRCFFKVKMDFNAD